MRHPKWGAFFISKQSKLCNYVNQIALKPKSESKQIQCFHSQYTTMEDTNTWEIGNLAEVTVSYVLKGSLEDRPKIRECYDVYRIAMQAMDRNALGMQEQFLAIYLNRANTVIGAKVHFIGGLSSVTIDIKVILVTAIGLMASGVIISHNHPSGNLEPSNQDKLITAKMKEALELVDVSLLDHLILSPDGKWLSFRERGLI